MEFENMKSLVVFALLLAASPAFSRDWTQSPPGVYWANNCDFYGRDIHITKGANSREACAILCHQDHRSCTHFTFITDTCYLKNSGGQVFREDDRNNFSCGYIPARI